MDVYGISIGYFLWVRLRFWRARQLMLLVPALEIPEANAKAKEERGGCGFQKWWRFPEC